MDYGAANMIGNILKIIATLTICYFLGLAFGAIFGIILGGIPSLLFHEIVYSNQTVLMSIIISLILGVLLGFLAMQFVNKIFSTNAKPFIGILLGIAVGLIIVFVMDGVIDISVPDLTNQPMHIIPIIYSGRVGCYIGGIIFPIIGASGVIFDIFASYTGARRNKNGLEEFRKFLSKNSPNEEKRTHR